MEISPDGTKLWIPNANPEETPYTGQKFQTVEEGVEFYKAYAKAVGFHVRHSTMRKTRTGEVAIKYMVCSREGFKPKVKEKNSEKGVCTETKKRRRVSKRVGCKARIVLTRNLKGEYKLHGVELRHTHCLCSTVARQFLKGNRKLDNAHKTFLANCAKANIGPTKGFRLYKEMVGSFIAIGATCIDFCNFRRDMLAYIAGADAQMVVEDLFKKNEMNPDFYFDFDLDDGGALCRLFWADSTSRRNFACFGDVMSFDATYRTNK